MLNIHAGVAWVLPELDLDRPTSLGHLRKQTPIVACTLDYFESLRVTSTKDDVLLVLGEIALVLTSFEFGLEFRKCTHEKKN